MKQEDAKEQACWEQFLKSGSVIDYLNYKQAAVGKEKYDGTNQTNRYGTCCDAGRRL